MTEHGQALIAGWAALATAAAGWQMLRANTTRRVLRAELAAEREIGDRTFKAIGQVTRERDEARAEVATLAEARDAARHDLDEVRTRLHGVEREFVRTCEYLAERTRERDAARADLGAVLEQRDAARVSFEHAQRMLAERTADRDGADMAHEDCERRLADMGERLAAETLAVGQAHERERRLEREVESLKASLQAAKSPQDAPQTAAAPEAQAAPSVQPKSRRRRP